jgi:hypothetical protein
MTGAELLDQASTEGVVITFAGPDRMKVMGNQARVEAWLPILRERKAELLDLLAGTLARRPGEATNTAGRRGKTRDRSPNGRPGNPPPVPALEHSRAESGPMTIPEPGSEDSRFDSEILALLNVLALHYGFTGAERTEAQILALADPVAALTSFRVQFKALTSSPQPLPNTPCSNNPWR